VIAGRLARQKKRLFMEQPWGQGECRVDEVDQAIRRSENEKIGNVLILPDCLIFCSSGSLR